MNIALESIDVISIVAVTVPLLLLFVASFVDLYRRDDLSVLRKALWAILILLTTYVGIAIYFIARPTRAPEGKRYGATVPRTRAIVDALEGLRAQHAAGTINDTMYLDEKRALLGLET